MTLSIPTGVDRLLVCLEIVMAIQVLKSTVINGYTFRCTGNYPTSWIRATGLGRWKLNNHSGLGNALHKAGFSQPQVKAVYAFIRQF